jgi:hypothetical protein
LESKRQGHIAYNSVIPPRLEKAPCSIDEIILPLKSLLGRHYEKIKTLAKRADYSVAKFPRVANSPASIDVILLDPRYLYVQANP